MCDDQERKVGVSRRTFVQGLGTAAAVTIVGRTPAALARSIEDRIPQLSLVPFLARPTTSSILINARNGDEPAIGSVQLRLRGEQEWQRTAGTLEGEPRGFFEWTVQGLSPGTRYEYRVMLARDDLQARPAAVGSFITQRDDDAPAPYVAALMTDSHTGSFVDGRPEVQVLDDVVRNVMRDQPEFVLALGDNVAWSTSRNQAQQNDEGAIRAYTMYRRHTGPLSMSCPHFGLIGNWEGETGKFPDRSIETVAAVRRQYAPNPNDETYPEGGSPTEDYYAFTWGPVLYVMLNVQTYTKPSEPLAGPRGDVARVEDWTLGETQYAWLEGTLAASTHPYKFVCCHHAVGGHAGNEQNSLYGRGGARCIDTGEQIRLHALMREHGVQIFFYGHDHVFVDDIADGIHYALPGSCGAPWKFQRRVTGYERYWTDSGHARLIVTPDVATVEYINVAGKRIHEFTVRPT